MCYLADRADFTCESFTCQGCGLAVPEPNRQQRRCDRCHVPLAVVYVLPAVQKPLRVACRACYQYLTRH